MKAAGAKVSQLAEQIRGVSFAKSDASPSPVPGYLPILRAGNITDDGLSFDDLVFVPADRVSEKQKLRRNDIVIAASSGSLDVVGKAAPLINGFDGSFGAFCKVLRPNANVDPGYFAHFFKTPHYRQRISAAAAGININNLRNEDLDNLEIPLPPLADQRRIAGVLDKAEALRARRRAALAKIDILPQAIFLELFGDPASNSKRWPVLNVSDYVAKFQGGKSIEAESGEGVITRNRVLKVSAVTGMRFLPAESKPVPDNYEPPNEHFVRSDDLLFSRANTTELVGAVAYVQNAPSNLLLPDKLWRFVWRDPANIDPLFIWSLFQTRHMRYEIGRRATGTSGSMKNISQEKVLAIPTILPPIELQRVFARRVEAVEKLKSAQRASLAKLDALFASLQHRAFRGEL